MPKSSLAPSRTPARSPAAPSRAQLLGVAFASADLAFEVGEDDLVAFMVGAAQQMLGAEPARFVGEPWRAMVHPDDAGVVALVIKALKPGERRANLRIRLASTTAGELAVFRLPGSGGGVSCVFRRGGAGSIGLSAPAGGLPDRETFERLAAEVVQDAAEAGVPLYLELLTLAGFEASTRAMSDAGADQARAGVADVLRAEAYGGVAATEVATDRYAVMRAHGGDGLAERLSALTGVQAHSTSAPIDAAATPLQALRALKFAIGQHISGDAQAGVEALRHTLRDTLKRANDFRAAVTRGRFQLAYQPVVELATGRLHHFEALARFEGEDGPEGLIVLAEELGLIEAFDAAVFQQVADTLRQTPGVRVAVNLSGQSLLLPGLVERLIACTATTPSIRKRLLVELTETSMLTDLPAAEVQIQRLRAVGHLVCLDDFGAGAASLDHLRRLTFDIVKIDGRYVRGVAATPRDLVMLGHIAGLCRALDVKVIAEMVEDEASAAAVKAAGIGLAQGWHYGRPQPTLQWEEPAQANTRLRRRGASEEWS